MFRTNCLAIGAASLAAADFAAGQAITIDTGASLETAVVASMTRRLPMGQRIRSARE